MESRFRLTLLPQKILAPKSQPSFVISTVHGIDGTLRWCCLGAFEAALEDRDALGTTMELARGGALIPDETIVICD
jgi:hypothetical protein